MSSELPSTTPDAARALSVVQRLEPVAATEAFGQALGRALEPGDLLAIDGPLGSGKTTLVRAIATGMGVERRVVHSPTFVMVNRYEAARGITLVHLDLYRLESAQELDSLGLDALETGPPVVMVVEWAQRAAGSELVGRPHGQIELSFAGAEARTVRMRLPATWSTRPGVALLVQRPPRRCPVTGRWVAPDSATYPFIDRRAQLADLHGWLSERYVVDRSGEEADPAGGS